MVGLMTHNSVWPVVSSQVVNGPPLHSSLQTCTYTETETNTHMKNYTHVHRNTRDTLIEAKTHTGWKHAAQELAQSHRYTHTHTHTQVHANSCFQHAEAVWKPLPLSGSNTFYSFTVRSNRLADHFHCTHTHMHCLRVGLCERLCTWKEQNMFFPCFGWIFTVFIRDTYLI